MGDTNKVLSYGTQILSAKDNTVYLVPSRFTNFGFGKKKAMQLLQTAVEEGFSYKIRQRHELPAALAAECSRLGGSVIFAYFLPDIGEYVYSIVKLSDMDDALARTMINNIKSCTFESRRNALINLAYNNPELLENAISSGLEPHGYPSEAIGNQTSYGLFSATAADDDVLHCPSYRGSRSTKADQTTLKEMATLMKRFLHNVRKYKEENDPVAKKEIDIILNNSVGVSDKLWETVFSSMLSAKSQKEFFNVCIDRYTLGKRSTMKIKVKQEDDNRIKQNHGKYYVVLEQGNGREDIVLDFKNQPTAVIYIMYLIDRKNKDGKVERLNLDKNLAEFTKLYHMIYGRHIDPDKIQSHINNLIAQEVKSESGESIQMKTGRLKQCYEDISDVLDSKMGMIENPLPFKVNARTHLTIPAANIEIAEELKGLRFI